MIKLIISIVALIVGASIYPIIKSRVSLLNFFDGLVFVSISGLVLLHLVPHCIEVTGLPAIVAIVLGFGIPMLFHVHEHKTTSEQGHNSHLKALIAIAFVGLGIHTFMDGLALSMDGTALEHTHASSAHSESASILALGVMLHRLPVGIFTAWILMPRFGSKGTTLVISTMAICTLLGYFLGTSTLPHASLDVLNILQALIAGTLLHVITHNARHDCPSPYCTHRFPTWFSPLLGSLTGLAILLFLQHSHAHISLLPLLGALAIFSAFWLLRHFRH